MRLRYSGLPSRKIGGNVVVVGFDSSRYLTINGSSVLPFELMCEAHDRDESVALLTTFEVNEHTARRDVDAFIADLPDARLLSR